MDETLVTSGGGAEGSEALPADGLLIGRYRLAEVLGRGGSGEVYAALDLLTDEPVAVKFVPPLSPHARRQLRRELSALLALRLPGVVRCVTRARRPTAPGS